jgi:hypothetical protein
MKSTSLLSRSFFLISIFLWLVGASSCRNKNIVRSERVVIVVESNHIGIKKLPEGWNQTTTSGKNWIKILLKDEKGSQSEIKSDWESGVIEITGKDLIEQVENNTNSKIVYH